MKNQCDGCQAGIPVVNGTHRMGREGGYPDLMGCTAKQYMEIRPEPSISTGHPEAGRVYAEALTRANATIAHQAQMIEHLRGGLTTPTSIDVANADADGYRNGFAAAIKSLPEQQYFTNLAAYTEWRAAQIEAVGDFGGEVKP